MLNGTDPLLIITLKNFGKIDLFQEGALVNAADVIDVGLPIPFYLSERPITGNLAQDLRSASLIPQLNGVFIDSETRSLDVGTKVDPVLTKGPNGEPEEAIVSQTCLSSQLTINLVSTQNNVMVSAIIALFDLLVRRLTSGEYSITYFNRSTVIIGALLRRFSTIRNPNDNLVRMEIVLETAERELPTPKAPIESIPIVKDAVHP